MCGWRWLVDGDGESIVALLSSASRRRDDREDAFAAMVT